jgi:hypothetical protein
MSGHWVLISLRPHLVAYAHLLRFAAFVLIALAVLDKNRRHEEKR